MRRTLILSAPLLAMLAACGTTRPPAGPPGSTPAPGAPGSPVPRPTLASESERLGELFRGTPVVFGIQADGSLRVTVPRKNCFDPGAIRVKPALAAVLERLARSPAVSTGKYRVTAPPDVEARNSVLAGERALSVRDYLVGLGVGPTRIQTAGAVQPDLLEIVLTA